MANQQSLDQCYMEVAESHAKLSKGVRGKVGACLVTKHGVILGGCNGMAPSGDNTLETKEYMDTDAGSWLEPEEIREMWPFVDKIGRYRLVTKPETIHAELSCILKAAREGVSVVGATLYSTLSCCKPCSEMAAASGVKRVVYKEKYRDSSGIENLKRLNVEVEQL